MILFKQCKCRKLDLDYVNTATGLGSCIIQVADSTTFGRTARELELACKRVRIFAGCKARPFHRWRTLLDEYKNDDYAEEWFAARDRVLQCNAALA